MEESKKKRSILMMILNFVNTIREFFKGTLEELSKCSWPNRQELFQSTILVICAVILLATYVALADQVRLLINFLTTS